MAPGGGWAATVSVTDDEGVQRSGSEALVVGDRVSVAVPEPLSAGSDLAVRTGVTRGSSGRKRIL